MLAYQDSIIDISSKIIDGIYQINSANYKILIVIDDKKVVGTITDGDIRRSIINKIDFNLNVSHIMNKNFYYIKHDQNITLAEDLHKKYDINFIPKINKNHELVDIVIFDQIKPIKEEAIFIMAGGKGQRLLNLTKKIPKALIPINGTPMIEIIINNFKKNGFRKFFISVNYFKKKIIDYLGDGSNLGVEIIYIEEDRPLGTAGSLAQIPKSYNKNLILINCDILTTLNFADFLNFHIKKKSVLTIGTKVHHYEIPYGVINLNRDNIVESINEKPSFSYLCNSGIYCLTNEVYRNKIINSYLDMDKLINYFIKKKIVIRTYPIFEYWTDIGMPNQLKDANNTWK